MFIKICIDNLDIEYKKLIWHKIRNIQCSSRQCLSLSPHLNLKRRAVTEREAHPNLIQTQHAVSTKKEGHRIAHLMASTSRLDIEPCKLVPLSVSSLRPCRPHTSKFLALSRPPAKFSHLRLFLEPPGAKGPLCRARNVVSVHRRLIAAVARADPDEGSPKQALEPVKV